MIRISANIARKHCPKEFSSEQFSAGMEVECSDADAPEKIKARLRELYTLLDETIQEQVIAAEAKRSAPTVPLAQPVRTPSTNRYAASQSNGNGHSRKAVLCTAAQQRAVRSIAAAKGLNLPEILREQGCADVAQMSLADCSALIDRLKSNDTGR